MKRIIGCTILFVSLAVGLSVSRADRLGIEYVADADYFIYGGIRFYSQSLDEEDLRTLRKGRLHDSASDILYQGQGSLSDIRVSVDAAYVGVLERTSARNVRKEQSNYVTHQYDTNGRPIEVFHRIESTLRILSLDGELIVSIPDVRNFAWRPDGHEFAYITGREYEGGFGFLTTGAWTYDIQAQEANRIFSGGYDIRWATWDGNIYLYDPFDDAFPETDVFRFDVDTKTLVPTSHRGIYFSPDGRHYFTQGYEGASIRVFETITENEIPADLSFYSADRARPREAIFAAGWFDDETLIVPSPFASIAGDYLYGIDAQTLWQADGTVLPARDSRTKGLVLEGASVVEKERSDFHFVR